MLIGESWSCSCYLFIVIKLFTYLYKVPDVQPYLAVSLKCFMGAKVEKYLHP